MIVGFVFAAISAVFVVIFLLAYLKSKGQYNEYVQSLDKKEYSMREFLPVGMYLNSLGWERKLIPAKLYAYFYKYKTQIKQNIIELYGVKYCDYHLFIHEANRRTLGALIAAGAGLISIIMAATEESTNAMLFCVISVLSFIGLPFLVDSGLKSKIEERRVSMRMEFPDFVNKLTILVNAGLTISKAWNKIITDNKKDTPLFREMQVALGEISAGKPEAVAYEEFGRRCKIKEIIKFVSVIVLNLKKGGAEVVPVLKLQAMECWEMRKSAAKQLGEQASTKVLIPMMIMFLGIIIIVVTPALLNFGSGM